MMALMNGATGEARWIFKLARSGRTTQNGLNDPARCGSARVRGGLGEHHKTNCPTGLSRQDQSS
jgi:hypothetical protein